MRALALLLIASLLGATPAPKATARASASPTAAPSASAPAAQGTDFKVGVWDVHMTQVDVNMKSGIFSTPDKILMTREGGDITGDRADGNYKTKESTIYGHVVMHDTQGNFAGLSSTKPAQSHGPSTLTADQVHIDGQAKVYTATGNVHYVQGDTTVDSDTGQLDDESHQLDLRGNVKIVQGERNMTAGHVIYNTITGQAHAEDNVVMEFPSGVTKTVATPKPLKLPNPLQKRPKPQPSPSASPK